MTHNPFDRIESTPPSSSSSLRILPYKTQKPPDVPSNSNNPFDAVPIKTNPFDDFGEQKVVTQAKRTTTTKPTNPFDASNRSLVPDSTSVTNVNNSFFTSSTVSTSVATVNDPSFTGSGPIAIDSWGTTDYDNSPQKNIVQVVEKNSPQNSTRTYDHSTKPPSFQTSTKITPSKCDPIDIHQITPDTVTSQPLDQTDLILTIVGHEVTLDEKCLYHIQISITGANRVIKKRFSDFYVFCTKLGIKGLKPPPKRSFSAQTSEFIQKRKEELHAFFSDLLSQKNIATHPEFIEFFEIKLLESKRRDHFFVAQQQLKQTTEELDETKTAKQSLEQQVDTLKKENSELTEKLNAVEQQAGLLHVENTNLQKDNESLRNLLRQKESQLADILEALQKVIKDHYEEKKVV